MYCFLVCVRCLFILTITSDLIAQAAAQGSPTDDDPDIEREQQWRKYFPLDGVQVGGVLADGFVVPATPVLGRPRTVVLSIWNLNSSAIPCWESHPLQPFNVIVHDAAGNAVPLTEKGRDAWIALHGGSAKIVNFSLAPGCAIGAKLVLDDFFVISHPGSYTALAIFQISDVIVAKAVKFDVKEADKTMNQKVSQKLSKDVKLPEYRLSDSFEKQWLSAMKFAGSSSGDLVLRTKIAPGGKGAIDLVMSVINICAAGTLAPTSIRSSYDNSYLEDGVKLLSGSNATDYQILLRSSSGQFVEANEIGRKWLVNHKIPWDRPLRPGEAVGFVVPLQEIFTLNPGEDYEALVVLPAKSEGGQPLAAKPLRFRLPTPTK